MDVPYEYVIDYSCTSNKYPYDKNKNKSLDSRPTSDEKILNMSVKLFTSQSGHMHSCRASHRCSGSIRGLCAERFIRSCYPVQRNAPKSDIQLFDNDIVHVN